jgi:hypothetical protein
VISGETLDEEKRGHGDASWRASNNLPLVFKGGVIFFSYRICLLIVMCVWLVVVSSLFDSCFVFVGCGMCLVDCCFRHCWMVGVC